MIKLVINIGLLQTLFLLMFSTISILAEEPEKISENKQILATVGPITITAGEFVNGYEYGPAFIRQKGNSKERYLDFMINEKLLALYGFEENIHNSEEFSDIHIEFVDDIATEEMFREIILPQVKISVEEIDTIIIQKNIDVSVKWIYSNNYKDILRQHESIIKNNNFDSLFYSQLSDSVLIDQRSMKKTRFHIGQRNPEMASILDQLEVGSTSQPIKTENGWYILKLESAITNLFRTESEYEKLKSESIRALKKNKMDRISDEFVHNLLLNKNPVIKRDALNILKAYLGKHLLENKVYDDWELENKLLFSLNKLNASEENIPGLSLINMEGRDISLKEFLIWYRNRSQYIKLDKSSYKNYSSSLEGLIWKMVRGEALTMLAKEKGYYEREIVMEQSRWWKEKIAYSIVRDRLINSINIDTDEIKKTSQADDKSKNEDLEKMIIKKIYRTLNLMKTKYPSKINKDLLREISVSSENDPDEINLYIVKKNSLIPRQPFPTIDFEWGYWE